MCYAHQLGDVSLYRLAEGLSLSQCHNLSFNFDGLRDLTDDAICHFLRACGNKITYLNLDGAGLTSVVLQLITELGKKLETLRVSFCEEFTEIPRLQGLKNLRT